MPRKTQSNKRIMVLLVAISCVLVALNITTVLVLGARQPDVSKIGNQYPLIDVSRNIIPQEYFLVNLQPLRIELKNIAYAEPEGTVAVYFEYLNTGANIQINEESRFYPASLVKLAAAMAAMRK